ncbi:SMP-30/gluconolactonase/LRE family protein [Vannielia litorea]|uniref:SMP-30/gluconolactonase/LRE family protein n=1 Tax=Vannielia litorea TaxID=1217970 RepID=UPI001C93F8FD|nr:SMP-30/gluconolactonase/LRE family protein [Vannielia litorea]MBY6154531.1 SMP-30/gluconolactonase/LRE family protein [Vannielia litorea]
MTLYDDTQCNLGEGPLWHPERQEFFWFDINKHHMHAQRAGQTFTWEFEHFVSAAGWVDRDTLLIASDAALFTFNLTTGDREEIVALEADNPATRSNDGRADPQGGFWIGTMGCKKETGAGAYYRYYRGELRQLWDNWSIPNCTCFTPDGTTAYIADTPQNQIWRVALDEHGWPKGDPEPWLTLPKESHRPDGAVCDTQGNLWIAQYGHSKVTVHAPDGTELRALPVPGKNTTCPAFGGEALDQLYVTTAIQEDPNPAPEDGCTYLLDPQATGQAEHQVIL